MLDFAQIIATVLTVAFFLEAFLTLYVMHQWNGGESSLYAIETGRPRSGREVVAAFGALALTGGVLFAFLYLFPEVSVVGGVPL